MPERCDICGRSTRSIALRKNSSKSNLPGVKIYDNGGGTADRYSVFFVEPWMREMACGWFTIGMGSSPYSPQGVCMTSTYNKKPCMTNCGRRISFADLPADCQKVVMDDYLDFYGVKGHPDAKNAVHNFRAVMGLDV